jgi:hypothetical protein
MMPTGDAGPVRRLSCAVTQDTHGMRKMSDVMAVRHPAVRRRVAGTPARVPHRQPR